MKEVSGAGQGLSTGPRTGIPLIFIGGLFAFVFTFVSQHIVAAADNRVGPAVDFARSHMDLPLDLEDHAIKALADDPLHMCQQSILYALK